MEKKKKKMPTTDVKHKTSKSRRQPLCARWPDHMQLQLTSSGLSGLTVEMQWDLGLRTPPTFLTSGGGVGKGDLRWEEVSEATD